MEVKKKKSQAHIKTGLQRPSEKQRHLRELVGGSQAETE